MEAWLARWSRGLEVDQLGFVSRKLVLVFQARDRHVRGDPAIALPVEADEDIALGQVGPVEFTWGVGPRPRLEEHRRQPQLDDGFACRSTLRSELVQGRTDKHAHALVRRADRSRHGGNGCRLACSIQWLLGL